MTKLTLNIPPGLETRMGLLIEGGLYYTKDELIADAVRRLLAVELETLVQHKYYWNKLTAERDVEVTEDELDRLIHEIRAEMID
ncbi:MAG: hypothetical protein J7J06_09140 [Methanosarcinales archaeon]|nr:hypothetical protein [Methanosarcinales archaeon]